MPRFNDIVSTATSKREYTDEGYLKVDAKIARTGTYQYLASEFDLSDAPEEIRNNPDSIVIVDRRPSDVFDALSLQSFANKPVTDGHPPEMVDASNVKKYQVGFSRDNITHDSQYMIAELIIQDKAIIDQINRGKVEVSNGYDADIVWEEGINDQGQVYDAYMTNIKGNHIAIVDRGRAGSAVRLSDQLLNNKPGRKPMPNRMIDGITVECTEQSAQVIDKLQAVVDKQQAMIDSIDTKVSEASESAKLEAQKTIDKMQAEIDSLKSKVMDEDAILSRVAARSALETKAKPFIGDSDTSKMTDMDIKKAVLAKTSPKLDLTDKSNDYIDAAFDLVDANKGSAQRAADALNSGNPVADEETDLVEKSKAKFRDASSNAWKEALK